MATVHSLDALTKLLQDNIQQKTVGGETVNYIILSAALLDEAGQVVGYFGELSIEVDYAVVTPTNYNVTLTGTATVLNVLSNTVLTGIVENGVVKLTFSVVPQNLQTWTFSQNFPGLPQSKIYNAVGIQTAPSFFTTTSFSTPQYLSATYDGNGFSTGLNFTAVLDATKGNLASAAPYIPGSSALPVSGKITITMGNPVPLINLHAAVYGFSINLLDTYKLTNCFVLLYSFYSSDPDLPSTSGATFSGDVYIGTTKMIVSAPLMQGNFVWGFDVQIPRENGISIGNSLSSISSFLGGWDLPLPPGLPAGFDIYLTGVNTSFNPQTWGMQQIGVTIAITTDWLPSLPNLKITEISITWNIYFLSDGTPNYEVIITGIFTIGTESDNVNLIVEVTYPTWTIHAFMKGGDRIDVSAAMNYFTGGAVVIPNLEVTIADFQGQPALSSYMFYTAIENVLPQNNPFQENISFGSFRQMNMEVDYTASMLSGYIMAQFDIVGKLFFVKAEKLPGVNSGWAFSGGLFYGYSFSAQDLVTAMTVNTSWAGYTLPDSLQSLALTELYLRFNTALSTYFVRAGLEWLYTIPDTDINLKASARFELNATRLKVENPLIYSGLAEGFFNINNFGVLMRYTFAPGSNTITFVFSYKKFELTATLSSKPDPNDKSKTQTLLTIGFGDLSFGEIIEYLVNLANPNIEFTLDSPWDILYDINFKNLTLTANLTTKEVGIWYKIDVNFVFVYIDSIGLTYKTVNGKGKVLAQITGRFLDQEYGTNGAEPLEWDVIDDPAPEVPGEESAFIDIRYVGLGQHVAINDVAGFENVEDVINALITYMRPPENGNENPLLQSPGLKFDDNSHWLFGLDITVIGMVRLAVVFNDPQLYGLLVALSGDRAGSLAGLKFQILYVKITDTIGVFRIELRIPEQFRQLEFGEVSITLPVIKLEIYTNGDFRVDLGFPHNGDFTDSFCLQVFPFIGYGGFYFAKLNGTTSKRVPDITNGTFNPVIELGLGLSVGLGKTFNKGPLKAGLSVTVEGIVEGVLAWFNPNDKSMPAPMYYWMKGTIAIVGKLYGSVDFAVIKVDVSVTAYASVTIVIESYAPILIELKVGVEVKASIKILFVRIHFSFSLELEEKFTIGDYKPTPWTIRQGSSSSGRQLTKRSDVSAQNRMGQLRMQRTAIKSPHTQRTHAQRKMLQLSVNLLHRQFRTLNADSFAAALTWNPSTAVFGSVQSLHITLTPSFTVAVPSALPGGSGNTPQVEAVMALFAENTIPTDASDSGAIRQLSLAHSARVSDPAQSPFNMLVQAMFLYTVNALPRTDSANITSADLELLNTLLADSAAYDTGFSYQNLDTFMTSNFIFQVSGIPSEGSGATPVPPSTTSATIFPMPPVMSMQLNGGSTINFATEPYSVTENYEDKITEYLEQLSVNVMNNVAEAGPVTPGSGDDSGNTIKADDDGVSESFAKMIFRDYFLMIARSSIQESISLLSSYPWTVSAGDSLYSIANSPDFPKVQLTYEVKVGDTWESVANMFGMTVAELQELNPDVPTTPIAPPLELQVLSGVTVQEVAEANQDVALNTAIPALTLNGVLYQAKSTDQISSIATSFGTDTAGLAALNASVIGLLAQASSFSIAQPQTAGVSARFSYTTVTGDSLNLISAWFLARLNIVAGSTTGTRNNAEVGGIIDGAMFLWYTQTIFTMNNLPAVDWQTAFTPGTVLTLPQAYNDVSTSPNPLPQYTTREGDTLDLVSAYFAMTQNNNTYMTDFAASVSAMNPSVNWNALQPGTVVEIPGMVREVQGNDTLQSLSDLFSISVTDLATVNQDVPAVIAPLAVFIVPPVTYSIVSGDTLAGIAAKYNLLLDELALDLENVSSLFPVTGSDGNPVVLQIPVVPMISVSRLQSDLVTKTHSNNISASVSRFLLNGLRLPLPADVPSGDTPIPASTPMYPAYALSGQQFTAPVQPITTPYNVLFTNSGSASWINFADSYVVQPGDTEASLVAQYPDIVTLNPDTDWANLQPGWVLLTSITASLTVAITDALAAAQYPSTNFAPVFTQPEVMRLYDDQEIRYTMQKQLHWQTPAALSFPSAGTVTSPLAGEPGIWQFPSQLITKLNTGKITDTNFSLSYTTGQNATADSAQEVSEYFWATLMNVQVRSVANTVQSGQVLPNTYELASADETNRDQLLRVWTYLQDNPTDTATIYILYPPNSSSANPSGLISAAADPQQTYMLKTNLSTETTSGGLLLRRSMVRADDEVGTYSAPLSSPMNFLQYIWEGIIIGTGGYYFNYSSGGSGLPGSVFDQSGNATVWLLVTLASQTTQSATVRNLQPFNNCAVSGDNMDAATMNVFAASVNATDLLRTANVQPGNTGFDMVMPNPDPTQVETISPTLRTQLLFSLFGYQVEQSTLFITSNQGLPLGPLDPSKNPSPPDALAAYDEETSTWHFHQVIPIATLAAAHPLSTCPALPAASLDPYAGIAIDGSTGKLGNAGIAFNFYDIFGNFTTPATAINTVEAPVGYYDDIIGFSQWPGLSLNYYFSGNGGAAGTPYFNMLFGFRIEDYIPGNGLSYSGAINASKAHQVRYKQIYYQAAQQDVGFSMSTSVVQTTSPPVENESYDLNTGQVLAYVNSAYVFLSAAELLGEGLAVISSTANSTLAAITAAYNCSYKDLAAVNLERKAIDIFAGTINIPYFLTTAAGQTFTDITNAANSMSPPATLTIQQIVSANMNAVLTAGIDFAVPSRTVTVNTADGSAATATLRSLSVQLYCTPAGIAFANSAPAVSIINEGILLTLDGLQYTTIANDSFTNIAAQFNAQGASVSTVVYTVGDVAGANADVPNLITANAQLEIADYFTQEKDTFPVIAALFPAYTATAILAIPANLLIKNVYLAGQALSVFSRTETPFDDDTLLSIANSYAITPEDIYDANTATPLQTVNHGTSAYPTNALTVPQLVLISAAMQQAAYVPYTMKTADTLNAIATAFYGNSSYALQLATLNETVTWVMAPGQTINLGAGTTTVAGDSFQSVLNRVNAGGGTVQLSQLVNLIAATPGYLQAASFLSAPLPSSGSAANNLGALETAFNISADEIARTNSSLQHFLAANSTVTIYRTVNNEPVAYPLTVDQYDTFNSLVYRYKTEGIETTVSEIALANKTQPIIAASQYFLLPPVKQLFTQSLGTGYSQNPHYPSTIFEVTVDITITRDKDDTGLINPAFENAPAVKSNTAAVAPRADENSDGQLTLFQFSVDFENAFTGLKVALGRSVDASDTKSGLRPVWAVYFGAAGISNFTINTVSPSYYALRPLSNTLVSKNNVFIQDYQAGVLTGGKNNNYQAVDMETWVLTFLSAVDLFLGPAYAAPASTLAGSSNAYNRIVSAKKTLADKISTGLDYVLDVTPDTAKLGKAREAIKDQLLINLTKAYNSDALLQYDIAIGSPFSGDQSPRLSGAPVSKLYRTGIADSVSTVATFMHVSVDYLTEQIDQFTGILNVGLVVTYPGGGDYTITNTDTIATVAQHYNVTSQALVAGLSWPDPQTQGLFLARTIITITGLSQVTGTQTIEQIAEFFAAPIVDWAYANEDNTGIFIEGVTISVPGYSSVLVTASNNSLDLVAAEMTGSPQMTATELALQLRSTTGILAPAFTSYMVLSNFSFSASTSKISLATGTNQVNFLLDVSSEAEYRKALLGLNYAIDELEFNIRDIAGADGYQASSWLSFVIPIGSSTSYDGVINTNLGQPDIPLPLRSYPVAPIITAQDAEATYTDAQLPATYPQNVEEASEWNFSFTYLHQEAAQDTNYIMATFNLATEAHSDYMQAAVPDDFFTAFAQFISVWPALKKDLDALAVPGTPPPTLGSTLDTLATLVENIADTWVFTSTHLSMTAVPAQQFYEYSIVSENEHHDDVDWKATMTLTPLTAGNTGPGGNYPNIYYIDTSVSPPVEHELTKTPGSTDCVYTYPQYIVPAIKQLEHRVEFIQLDVMNYQNALGGSFAARNMLLTATPTNENFVFQTPEVLYSHSIVPYITRGVALEFGSGDPGTQLETALTDLFSNLFGSDTPLVKISALYGYELATGAGSTAIVSRLPIVFLPMMTYDSSIPANLAQAVNSWLSNNPVATQGGELLFDLSVFSGTDESNSKPLLRLSNLIYALSN